MTVSAIVIIAGMKINSLIIHKMKKVNLFVAFLLICSFGFSQQEVDKKCKVIYANYLEKDSLLKLSEASNDSLQAVNKQLLSELNKAQGKLDAFERDSKLITIGNQKWDVDNLKVTTLNDGTPIYFADTRAKWDSLFRIGEPAYCFHRDDSTGNYGYIYNYYAVESGKLAPIGMKIPSYAEVDEMLHLIATEDVKSALLLKSKDTTNAATHNWKIKGNNRYGLNIKPYGFRLDDSKEWYFGNKIYYWCQVTEPKKIQLLAITEINDDPFLLEKVIEEKNSNYGLYVRCIKQ